MPSSPSRCDRGDRAGVGQRVAGEHRARRGGSRAADHRVGPGPVGEEPAAVAGVGEDVHEDVGRALLVRVVAVVVHRHEVARRDRARDDARSASRRSPSAGARRRRDRCQSNVVRVPVTIAPPARTAGSTSRRRTRSKRTATGMPIVTSSGATPTRLRDEPRALLELDERHDVAVVEPRQRRVVRHHEAVHRAATRRFDRCPTRASGSAGTSAGAGGAASPQPRSAGSAAGARFAPSQKNCVSAVIDGASRALTSVLLRVGTSGCGTSGGRRPRPLASR